MAFNLKLLASQSGISMEDLRRIIPGKTPDFENFRKANLDLEPSFQWMGWVPFLSINEPIYPLLVRDFWKSSTVSSDTPVCMISGNVSNDLIVITRDLLAEVIGCPNLGALYDNDWSKRVSVEEVNLALYGESKPTDHRSKFLLPKVKMMYQILKSSVFPKLTSIGYVSKVEKFALFNLSKGLKTNLIDLLMNHMLKTSSDISSDLSAKISYPFGMILTRLFKRSSIINLQHHFGVNLCTPLKHQSLTNQEDTSASCSVSKPAEAMANVAEPSAAAQKRKIPFIILSDDAEENAVSTSLAKKNKASYAFSFPDLDNLATVALAVAEESDPPSNPAPMVPENLKSSAPQSSLLENIFPASFKTKKRSSRSSSDIQLLSQKIEDVAASVKEAHKKLDFVIKQTHYHSVILHQSFQILKALQNPPPPQP